MTPLVEEVALDHGAVAWFTGRDDVGRIPVGRPGNLAHGRPHQPGVLARDRAAACARMDLDPDDLHLMLQVHGAAVGEVTAATTPGAELEGVDVLVTREPGRALAVQVADCVPLLLAAPGAVAAAHAGRRGLRAGVVPAAVEALRRLAGGDGPLVAVLGPAIGGCCYEVPEALRAEVSAGHPATAATTTWGTPALDLPAGVAAALRASGVTDVHRHGGCTHCDPARRWFSHRRDRDSGRQLGVVVRRGPS